VNARAVASSRGIDLLESSSTRSRVYRSLVSLQLKTSAGLRWLEGTTAPTGSRLVLLDGVPLEAPLTGTILLFENNDQPGVVATLGTVLAKHGINIAKFSLGRIETGNAVGAVQVDEPKPIPNSVLEEIRALRQFTKVWLVRV
jgi:D-3-phosphoglycerate dehydrogenase